MENQTIKANEDNDLKYLNDLNLKKSKQNKDGNMNENTQQEEELQYFTE